MFRQLHQYTKDQEYSLLEAEYTTLVFSLTLCLPAAVVGGLSLARPIYSSCSRKTFKTTEAELSYDDVITYCAESAFFLSNQAHVGPGVVASVIQGFLRGCVKIIYKLQQHQQGQGQGQGQHRHCQGQGQQGQGQGQGHSLPAVGSSAICQCDSCFLPMVGGELPPMAVLDMCLLTICRLIDTHGAVLQSSGSLTVEMLTDATNEVDIISESNAVQPIADSVSFIYIVYKYISIVE
jgi:hypothetical protein